MSTEKTLQIFIAYSRRDVEILEELRIHLKVLERFHKVKIWYDGLIEAGHDWDQSIKANLHQSDIILLLISQNFLASDYCYDEEMMQALALHEAGKVRAIPIIARRSLWKRTPFARLQVLPKDGKPIRGNWGEDKELPYIQISEALESVISAIRVQKDGEAGPSKLKIDKESLPSLEKLFGVSSNQFIDPRDRQTYKTVQLLGKTWLAENLNYDVGGGCWFYENDPANGKKYGRLYTWEAAKRACPPGWRLPKLEEIDALLQEYGSGEKAYQAMIKGGRSGFDALFSGYRMTGGMFAFLEVISDYWLATKSGKGKAYNFRFHLIIKSLEKVISNQGLGFSVRCIRD
ncbi:MAG: FISUMP domain-containing protein [Bacteroidota bacterium]